MFASARDRRDDRLDLLVLGAGPAGVGAAYRAARAGHSVVVVERSGRVGGAAGSIEIGGMRVDLGSHRLHPSIDPAIVSDLRQLLGPELQKRTRNGRIRLAGRWLAFPLRTKDLLRRLPPSFALGATRDAATAWLRTPRSDSFAEVLRAGLGPTMSERFYFPYARKVWGLEPEQLSGEQARRRVSADSPLKVLQRVARGSDRGGARGASFFWYPRRGYGAISEALAGAAVDAGAQLRLAANAERIDLDHDRVKVTLSGGESYEARRVWSTIPLTVLAAIAEPSPPPEVLSAAASLRFRAMLLVYLVLARDRYTSFDAHYFPEAFTPVTRISEPKNYRDGDDPSGCTVLCAEIPCDPGDELWESGNDALGAIVEAALGDAGLPPVSPLEVKVVRLAHAYPVYSTGYAAAFEALDAWATAQPRLLTLGRQGLFAHDNAHHALAMAWAAADALGPGDAFDDEAWASARARFTHHVVED